MNDTIIVGLFAVIALLATSLYWRRRERIVREGLTTSQMFDARERTADSPETRQAATAAARTLSCSVSELPARVQAIDDERRSLRNEIDTVREHWAAQWWHTVAPDDNTDDWPSVVHATLPKGDHDDVTVLAKQAMDEPVIAILVGGADASLGVAVGQELTDHYSASDIAREITDHAGGGAGGTDQLATGGTGADDTDELEVVCRSVGDELTDRAVQTQPRGVHK